jgi:shikimate kinase
LKLSNWRPQLRPLFFLMNTYPNIFLIGPMGSGKTAVGKQLSRLLDEQFYDSDREIERITGVDIPYIFEKEGEAGFRARETEVIDNLTQLNGIVLATGGGAILAAANRERLRARGQVVYLRTSVHQQLERTKHSHHRPLLHNTDPEARLRDLFAIRQPLYEELAHLIVNTDHRRVSVVAQDIIQGLNLTPVCGVDESVDEH